MPNKHTAEGSKLLGCYYMKGNGSLFFVFHRGEEQYLADVLRIGEQHAETVNSHADSACGRHAIPHRIEEGQVHALGFVIATFPGFKLNSEAFLLIEGVIKLAIGVAEFEAAHEEFEAVDEARIRGLLCKRRNFNRIRVDECRLDEVMFDEFVEERLNDITNAVPALFEGDVMLFRKFHRFFEAHLLREVDAGFLLDGLGHRNPTERLGEIDFDVAPLHDGVAIDLLSEVLEQAFDPFAHRLKIAIGLIELNGGELGVMPGVDAFIAEDPADFIDAVDSADHRFLEVQFRRNTEIEVLIKRVVVRDERSRRGAANDWGKDRGLDLNEA